jgi:flagellar biosynthesis/type III secretory pathway chaperone
MTPPTMDIDPLVDELVGVLDDEIALLELRVSQLQGMSDAILSRNEEELEKLLDEVERTEQLQSATDSKLKGIRMALAGVFGCEPDEMKLSRLILELPPEKRLAVSHRREHIVRITETLRRKHLETAILLSECARINRMLLSAMFPDSQTATTYSAEGAEVWRPDTGLVDAER